MKSDKELLELLLRWVVRIKPEWFSGMCDCIDSLSHEFKYPEQKKAILSKEESFRLNELILLHKPVNYSTKFSKPYWWVPGVKAYRINFLKKIIKKY